MKIWRNGLLRPRKSCFQQRWAGGATGGEERWFIVDYICPLILFLLWQALPNFSPVSMPSSSSNLPSTILLPRPTTPSPRTHASKDLSHSKFETIQLWQFLRNPRVVEKWQKESRSRLWQKNWSWCGQTSSQLNTSSWYIQSENLCGN